jgi:hypothetical protein
MHLSWQDSSGKIRFKLDAHWLWDRAWDGDLLHTARFENFSDRAIQRMILFGDCLDKHGRVLQTDYAISQNNLSPGSVVKTFIPFVDQYFRVKAGVVIFDMKQLTRGNYIMMEPDDIRGLKTKNRFVPRNILPVVLCFCSAANMLMGVGQKKTYPPIRPSVVCLAGNTRSLSFFLK